MHVSVLCKSVLWHIMKCSNNKSVLLGEIGLGVQKNGWPDIHWLAGDLGWTGGSHCASLGQELYFAVGA